MGKSEGSWRHITIRPQGQVFRAERQGHDKQIKNQGAEEETRSERSTFQESPSLPGCILID